MVSDISTLNVESDSDEELVSGSAQAHSVFNLAELARVMDDVYAFCTSHSYYHLIRCKSYRASDATDIAAGSLLVGRHVYVLMTQISFDTSCTSAPVQEHGSTNSRKQRQKEKYVYILSPFFSVLFLNIL